MIVFLMFSPHATASLETPSVDGPDLQLQLDVPSGAEPPAGGRPMLIQDQC